MGCDYLARGALGLGALIAGYFSDTVRQLLPTPRKLARWVKRLDMPPAVGTQFTVLVADLKRDTEGSQTDHVAAALAPYQGIDVIRLGPGPEWDIGSRAQLLTEARRLLEAKNGDVLMFGEVAKADERLPPPVPGPPGERRGPSQLVPAGEGRAS